MKYLRLMAFVGLFLPFVASCSSNSSDTPDNPEINLTCTPEEIAADAAGGTYTLSVTCSRGEWTAFVDDNCISWISLKVSGSATTQGSVAVTVAQNSGEDSRTGKLFVKSGSVIKPVTIKQMLPLQVSATQIFSRSLGETLSVTVSASTDWSVKANDAWLKAEKSSENTISVTTEVNDSKQSRKGSLDVTSGNEKITITVNQESAEDRDIVVPEGYHLVWHDEFNDGSTLSNEWTHEVQGPGWVNNELQTYVNGQADGKRVTEIKDGRLNINCFKGSDGKIYSGRVYAKVNTGWLYGYFEARIQLPTGKGTWPAWWMMPVNNNFSTNPWPGCGEIDILEEVGADPNQVSSSIHCKAYNHTIGTQKTHAFAIPTAESDYHTYAVEWTPDYLSFIFDGKEHMRFTNEGKGKDVWPFTYAFYPILNLAWGGSWGGYKGVDESALPATMKVDYVRVFQK